MQFRFNVDNLLFTQAASYPHIEQLLEGIILTSPALRVKPSHPIVGVSVYGLLCVAFVLYKIFLS